MKTLSNLDRWTLLLGIAEVALTITASVFLYGAAEGNESAFRENRFFPVGFNPYRGLALRCLMIAGLLLLSTISKWLFRSFRIRLLTLIPLALVIWQCVILTRSASDMPQTPLDYLGSPQNIQSMGYCFIAMTTLLFMFHIKSIWAAYHLRPAMAVDS